MAKRTNGKLLSGGGQSLLVMLMVCCLMAVGSPAQADPPGSAYVGIWGDFVVAKDGTRIVFGDGEDGESFSQSVTFSLGDNGKSIGGSGDYRIEGADGETIAEGTWTALKLDGFHSYGRCRDDQRCLDRIFEIFGADGTDWEAGKMTAKIGLEGVGVAKLTVWCRLPFIKNLPPSHAVPESYRVRIGSVTYGPAPGAGTLFVRTE